MQVAAIYRVSTDKQLRGDGDDAIPVQRAAVREFIAARPGWHLVREYAEAGVSGFKVSADDRDVLQAALGDARAGLWQVLVVFKADRLSRNSLEYPVVVDRFRRLGVAIWSVKDAAGGKLLALDSQMDKFVRFLEGWQAETESKNTSIRVSEAMLQLAKQGKWSGGPVPYGFKLNPARRPKSGAPALVIDPFQAAVIQRMVDLAIDQRMGGKLIATTLGREGIPNRGARPWDDATVRRILQNPIIAGLPANNRTRAVGNQRRWKNPYDLSQFVLPRDQQGNLKPIPEYQIIPLERWLTLLRVLESNQTRRKPIETERHGVSAATRAAGGVLTGLLYCGHCGARLSAASARYKQPRKDGTVTVSRRGYYICRTHLTRGADFCRGQRTYGRTKLESAVLDRLRELLTGKDRAELEAMAVGGVGESAELAQHRSNALTAELARAERVLAGWLDRMDAFLAGPGDSPYSEEVLVAKIRQARERRDGLRTQLATVRTGDRQPGVRPEQLDLFVDLAPHWWAGFQAADALDQKLMLRDLVERVVARRTEVEIVFRVDLASFLPKLEELAAARDFMVVPCTQTEHPLSPVVWP